MGHLDSRKEQVADAAARLKRFQTNPAAPEFLAASSQAAKAREAEARELAEYQKRVRTGKSLFPKMGGYGVGLLTFGLIIVCVHGGGYTRLGADSEFVRKLLLADPKLADGTFLPQVRAGEFWRLFSSAFIHFGLLHLLSHDVALPARQHDRGAAGRVTLALLVAVTDVGPMIGQYLWSGPGYVGGMSGVVYGLAGYVWMRGKYDRASGVFLDRQNVQWLLIWLVICFTGAVGNVAECRPPGWIGYRRGLGARVRILRRPQARVAGFYSTSFNSPSRAIPPARSPIAASPCAG